jgi:hypothetical protein
MTVCCVPSRLIRRHTLAKLLRPYLARSYRFIAEHLGLE